MKKLFSLGLLSLLSAFFLFVAPSFAQQDNADAFLVLTLQDRIINPVTADYVSRGIDEAERKGFQGVILQMDTPGGLLESTRSIVKKILNARVPVIVYIAPSGARAGSAGVFITLAAHVAAMAPSTNIGAAHPVMLGQEEGKNQPLEKKLDDLVNVLRSQKTENPAKQRSKKTAAPDEPPPPQKEPRSSSTMEDKILNDTLAWIETISKNKGRNADWARRAVFESASATEKEAVENKIVDLIAADMNDLLAKLEGRSITLPEGPVTFHTRNARLIPQDLTLRQTILDAIANPNIAYGLLMLGVLGLFIEITHPGVIFPGVLGVICLVVALYAFAMLPINFAGALLVGMGILFFVAEALTPATFGLLTLAGAASMLIGSLMLIDSPFAFMRVSLNVVLPFVLAVGAVVLFLVTRVVKAHRQKSASGPLALVGRLAVAQADFETEGQVFLDGELWTALNKGPSPVKKGDKVRVLEVDKVKLIVSK